MRFVMWSAIAACAACGRIDFGARATDAVLVDAVPEACAAGEPPLDPLAFSAPVRVAGLYTTDAEDDPAPSDDGMELFFTSTRPGGMGAADIWEAFAIGAGWSPPAVVENLESPANENTPALSADGFTMWFVSDRNGVTTADDIWVARRPGQGAAWEDLRIVGELNSPALDRGPSLFLGDRAMLFHSARGGETAFYVSTRPDTAFDTQWTTPQRLASPAHGLRGWMSPCGLELYYEAVPAGSTTTDLYVLRREHIEDDFDEATATRLATLSADDVTDQDIRLSPDRKHAYFASDRDGNSDLFESSR